MLADVKTTTLGRSGLNVSRIAFGTWQLGGEWGRFDEDAAVAAIRRARELGVNFFDTAQAYGFGASERILGRALGDELTRNRDEIVIATKGGLRQTDSGLVRDASPEWLRRRRGAGHRGADGRAVHAVAGRDMDPDEHGGCGVVQPPGRLSGLGRTSALLPHWHAAIAGDHGDDDIASAITAAATTGSPPGQRLSISAI